MAKFKDGNKDEQLNILDDLLRSVASWGGRFVIVTSAVGYDEPLDNFATALALSSL